MSEHWTAREVELDSALGLLEIHLKRIRAEAISDMACCCGFPYPEDAGFCESYGCGTLQEMVVEPIEQALAHIKKARMVTP